MRAIFCFIGRKRPTEEWSDILDELGHPYVKFRDPDSFWYMEDRWKDDIQRALDKHGRPALSFGSSMGGWGALYHQPQIQAHRVLAFTPQGTTIASEVRHIGGDKAEAWAYNLDSVQGSRLPPPDGKSVIYFGDHRDDGVGDSGHKRLIVEAGYEINTIKLSKPNEHNIVGLLHAEGKLIDIIKEHLRAGAKSKNV